MTSTPTGPNQVPGFTPDGAVGTSFGAASSNVALPGTPASDSLVRVANLGPNPISVALGGSTVVAALADLVIFPGQVMYLTMAGETYIAGIAHGCLGMGSTTNVVTGN